jgi:hypothetical protein
MGLATGEPGPGPPRIFWPDESLGGRATALRGPPARVILSGSSDRVPRGLLETSFL